MNWKRRASILAILALAQAAIIVCYQGFLTAGPAPAMSPSGEKFAPKQEAPKPTDEPPVAPTPGPMAIAVPVSPVAPPPPDEPKKLPDLGKVAMPVVPPAGDPEPMPPGGAGTAVVPVAAPPKEPLPPVANPAPSGLPDVPPVGPLPTGKDADVPPPPKSNAPSNPTPLPKELADPPPASTPPPPSGLPSIPPPGDVKPVVGQVPPPTSTPSTPAPLPQDKDSVPPPPQGDFNPPPKAVMPQAAPAPQPAVIKDIQCPWILRVEIVKGRTLMTASTGKEIQFRVSCDKLDLSAPNGRITAAGNVQVSSEGLDGSCETLTIAWQEDRVILEGQAELRSRRDGQEMDMKAAKLSLRLSVARPDERVGKRAEVGKAVTEPRVAPALLRSEPRPREAGQAEARPPQVIETRQVGGTRTDD